SEQIHFGKQPVLDAVELVADVMDRAAGGGDPFGTCPGGWRGCSRGWRPCLRRQPGRRRVPRGRGTRCAEPVTDSNRRPLHAIACRFGSPSKRCQVLRAERLTGLGHDLVLSGASLDPHYLSTRLRMTPVMRKLGIVCVMIPIHVL